MNRITALAMVALTINLWMGPATAQTDKDAQRLARVERSVNKIGVDENIKVTLVDRTTVKGRLSAIGPDWFVVVEKKTANPRRISFVQVKEVKAIADNPLGDPGVLMGLAFIPAIVVLAVIARGQ